MSKRTWLVFSILFDLIAVNAAIILAFYIRFMGELPLVNFSAYSEIAIAITITYFISAYLSSIYAAEDLFGSGLMEPVLKAVTISWLLLAGFIWLFQAFSFPRLVFVLSWFLAITFIYSWRYLSLNVLRIDWPKQNILIIGNKPIAKDIIEKLKSQKHLGYQVVGIIADVEIKKFAGVDILGKPGDIANTVKNHNISRIIITIPLKAAILEQLAELGLQDLKIEVVPDLYEILVGKVDYNTLTDIPLLELTNSEATSSYRIFKRFLDVTISSAGLLALGPTVILPAAIAIKLSSKGPVLYKQQRVGKNQNIFTIIKLRTMREDAEERTGAVFASKKDSRVTTVGRILRTYRLDELPQLVNILKGEMSFVGPRPERPEFVEQFLKEIPGYASRFKLKPGATGLAQISGSYATDAANKLKFDLFYLYHRTLFLDIKITFKTIKVMISGTGSH